jgi:hypothetical protein
MRVFGHYGIPGKMASKAFSLSQRVWTATLRSVLERQIPIRTAPVTSRSRGCRRGCGWGCAVVLLGTLGLAGVLFSILQQVPADYGASRRPLTPPPASHYAGAELEGFESPYFGHTGSWDGKGGALWGGSKLDDLAKEQEMGLRWTFMPVYWRALEPEGPVDPDEELPSAWAALDAFVIQAQRLHLNILMQAPVVGGNAQGPPEWAGRRERGKSAPANMEAVAQFAGKLARRYAPGGVLARREGWGTTYGVRAWELDNEPESYRTHWKGQAGDYAEFVTRTAAAIREVDPGAWIVLPGCAGGGHGLPWIEAALDADAMAGSQIYREQGRPYSIGPVADVVSFHLYEGLDSALSRGDDRTVAVVLDEVRDLFEVWEQRVPDFTYAPKTEFWHTEGNYDFLGVLSAPRRAAWRMQFFTRAFAAGVRKVCVMDASRLERVAIRAYVSTLPDPFPMTDATLDATIVSGAGRVFRHDDRDESGGRVWVVWARPGTEPFRVALPARYGSVRVVRMDGKEQEVKVMNGEIVLQAEPDRKLSPPLLVIDRPSGT